MDISSLAVYYGLFLFEAMSGHVLTRNMHNLKSRQFTKRKLVIDVYRLRMFITFILMVGFASYVTSIRVGVGGDYYNYERIFSIYKNIDSLNSINVQSISYEVGLWFVIKLVALLGGEFHEFLFISAFIIYGFALLGILENGKGTNIGLMVFIYFTLLYGPSFNIIKQMIAGSIIFWGFKYIHQKNLKKYIVIVLISSIFHLSAICLIALYFVEFSESKTSSFRTFALILLAAILPFVFETLFMRFSSMTLFAEYGTTYTRFFNSSGTIKSLLFRLPILLPVLLYYSELMEGERDNKFYFLLLLFEYSSIVMSFFMHWAIRISYYFTFSEVILSSRVLKIQNRNKKIVWTLFYVFYYATYFYMVFYVWGDDGLFPYVTIFA